MHAGITQHITQHTTPFTRPPHLHSLLPLLLVALLGGRGVVPALLAAVLGLLAVLGLAVLGLAGVSVVDDGWPLTALLPGHSHAPATTVELVSAKER